MAVILYEPSLLSKSEREVASKYISTSDVVVGLNDQLVIGRYSVLPFYRTLERNLEIQGSRLINSKFEHDYVANFDYYFDLEGKTPKTWFNLVDVPKDGGPFVVKGQTNSKKLDWERSMYAPTFSDVMRIAGELQNDSYLCSQGVIVRQFEKLKVLETGISGLPFSNEWRFFFLGQRLLAHGFYWEISESKGEINDTGIQFAKDIAKIVSEKVNFFVVDIAQKENGEWILIEINDGQMSGLSEVNAEELYANLAEAIKLWE